jgi:Ca-activated chloride channel family protein
VGLLFFLAIVGSILGSATSAAAQQRRAPPVFSVGLEVVNLTVTVRDEAGNLVTDLEREDFRVLEDDREQQIALFGRAHDPGQDETMALDLGLLMDTSESMIDMLRLSRYAAVRFLDTIPRARDLMTIFFGEEIRISRYNSEQQQGLFARINSLESGGNTALHDAVTVYLSRVEDARGRKVAVLFSDGQDTCSTVSQSELLYLVRSSAVTIYPIAVRSFRPGGPDDLKSMAFLNQLADLSGGQLFSLRSSRDLTEIYRKILAEIESQYVLGFIPDNLGREEDFRELKVELSRSGLKPRHRKGYYTFAEPEPEPEPEPAPEP